MTVERRDTFRVRPASREAIKVELSAAGMLDVGELVDISEGGIGLRLEGPPGRELVGFEVELVIQFHGVPAAYAKGVIRSARQDGVIGVQFRELSSRALESIRSYVSGRGRRHSGNFKVGG